MIRDLPDLVLHKACALGATGRNWLNGLDAQVRHWEAAWEFTAGATLSGGSEALVLEARLRDGRMAVLKIWLPEVETMAGELTTLQTAGGTGYATVLDVDEGAGAVLLERLGRPLGDLGWPVGRQIETLCATLATAWRPPPASGPFLSGREKVERLMADMTRRDRLAGGVCPTRLVERLGYFTRKRAAAHATASAVLAHGDSHAWNALQVPDTPAAFKFVDPDGLIIERAYDAGLMLRDWDEGLMPDPLARGLARCHRIAILTGLEPAAIWQWGIIERVSTALYLIELQQAEIGRAMLAIADTWATQDGP